jgi:drug/metabolite transporter (DMT)-like permease
VERKSHHPLAFGALLLGNVALAFGPWLVRLADTGPVAAGFWRVTLALPFLWIVAIGVKQRPHWPRRTLVWVIFGAATFYALDLAAWNAGIRLTKLGNATLFGNVGSFVLVAWGLWLARRWPKGLQELAIILAMVGAGLLMGSSYELSARHVRGDLLTLVAGLLYGGYLVLIERVRGELQPLPVLILATLFAIPPLLIISVGSGEQLWPHDWTPLLIFALSSQVVGQGLLVYALGTFPPLIVGLALLTQPAISSLIGWLAYREGLSALDWIGAAAIAAALVLVRLPDKTLQPATERPS